MKTEICKLYSRAFEYFCQMSQNLVLTISSYTVPFQSSFVFYTVYINPYSLIINSWFSILRTDGNLYIRGFQ